MTLVKKIKDKKVNFEFNKEFIKVVTQKISNNDAEFITNSFKEMHPADAADIIEHLSEGKKPGPDDTRILETKLQQGIAGQLVLSDADKKILSEIGLTLQ